MKILFLARADLLRKRGGDTTQILNTKSAIERLGGEVEICLGIEDICGNFDIAHIFNIQTSELGLKQLLLCKQKNLPVVVSTIYWRKSHIIDDDDWFAYHSSTSVRAMAFFPRPIRRRLFLLLARGRRKVQEDARKMLELCDLILPNSITELEMVVSDFHAPSLRSRSEIVVNAVNGDIFDTKHRAWDQRDGVAIVGRIEPVKGQLRVINSLMDRPQIPIHVIGRECSSHYFQACRSAALERGNVHFWGERTEIEVQQILSKCRVHVLPSLRESPGLVSLEAVLCGCNIVVANETPFLEYFPRGVLACEPEDVLGLRDAINEQYLSSFRTEAYEYIRDNFTWDRAAKQTISAYKRVLNS